MYEIYLDDSGTDPQSQLAIAAGYISTERGWKDFVKEWDTVRYEEGFSCFHMVDFAASHDKTKKPFCDWTVEKRERVYQRIAKIINENKRIGLGVVVPKDIYDRLVAPLPEWLRWRLGRFHYTFAIRTLMGKIKDWRTRYNITLPMQYFFDRMAQREARAEIDVMWEGIEKRESWSSYYGMEKESGYSFRDKCAFKPLQSADILAWQLNSHMRNVIMAGRDDEKNGHPHFDVLRLDQVMDMGYYTEKQLQDLIDRYLASGEPKDKK